jgi:hypothetical protein
VCHGGAGTTLASLRAAVPLLVLPQFGDQPSIAEAIETSGTGLGLGSRPVPAETRKALGSRPSSVVIANAVSKAKSSSDTSSGGVPSHLHRSGPTGVNPEPARYCKAKSESVALTRGSVPAANSDVDAIARTPLKPTRALLHFYQTMPVSVFIYTELNRSTPAMPSNFNRSQGS